MGQDIYDNLIAPEIGDPLEQIRDLPASQITVDGAGLGRSGHHWRSGQRWAVFRRCILPGGITLEALRAEVGYEAFFNILRTYVERYSYSNVTTDDFIAVAEEVSGQQLDDLFDGWLFRPICRPCPT